MCSSNTKLKQDSTTTTTTTTTTNIHMNRRRVLAPNCNRIPLLERRNSMNSRIPTTTTIVGQDDYIAGSTTTTTTITPPASPSSRLKSPRVLIPPIKRSNHHVQSALPTTTTTVKPISPTNSSKAVLKKSKSMDHRCLNYSSSIIVEAPGSIAAARREHVATLQEQRKMRIAHYGRTNSSITTTTSTTKLNHNHNDYDVKNSIPMMEKRCSFITVNSDPIYVAYHDEEWGVPVHDDNMLFELLVLTGAQVGSDWTSVLRKRESLRDAFSGFDPLMVSKFNEKKMSSISIDCGIELSQVRGVVDNSKRILEIQKKFGSFDNYLWGFVNNKPIHTQYKWSQKIPAKTSKSESISKDMVKKGFRLVGPTVIHSFMQAAGLTNDHLITCDKHSQCALPTTSSIPTTTTITTPDIPFLPSLIIV